MVQRNMLCTTQMFEMENHQQAQPPLHPEPCYFMGNVADIPRTNIYPVLSASGNTSNIDNGIFNWPQYNGLQQHHPIANPDFGIPVSNFYDPYMVPSRSRMFPVQLNRGRTEHLHSSSNHGIIGVNLGENERNNHLSGAASVAGSSLEIGTMGEQGYQEITSSANSAVPFYPPSIPHQQSLQQPRGHHHHHVPPTQVQGLQVHNFSFHPQVPASSYWHPTNNASHRRNTEAPSSSRHPQVDTVPGSRYQRPHHLPTGFRLSQPNQRALQQQMSQEVGLRPHLIILPEDEVAMLEFSVVGNFRDHHRDMRLDIDHMSYEELLALGERIGNVRTGLRKETIIRNLETRYYVRPAPMINLDGEPSTSTDQGADEAETCVICQEEFKNMEKIATLRCGHEYHSSCISKWLRVKNVCPICKTSALPEES